LLSCGATWRCSAGEFIRAWEGGQNLSLDITISLLIDLVSDNTHHQVSARLAELFQ
jgi:hypothetical protein